MLARILFSLYFIYAGLSCWEIENFVPNQIDDGMESL